MSKIAKYIKYIKAPSNIIVLLNNYKIGHLFPDKFYLKCWYKANIGKKLNLKCPQSFNEKLQWLKLYNRKKEYSLMVDKYAVKKYVSEIIGEEYIIPTLGIWDRFDDINFDELPNQFVLKCTHDSGGLVICRDKSQLNIEDTKRKINRSLKRNYYWHGREWPYKNVSPRILAEKYMENNHRKGKNLNVYKIMTFNSVPKIIQTIQNDKTKDEVIDYFDCNWHLLNIRQNYPNSNDPLPRPQNLQLMLDLAQKMSVGFPFLRVDFYEINGKIYFSEFTFYSDSGTAKFHPEEWDNILGSWIELKA